MANVMLAWPNLADTSTLTGGSWNASFPLANLQNKLISKVARSANALAASTTFDINLGSAKAINAVGLIGNNLSAAASYRIRGSTVNTFATTVYDSGTLAAATQAPNLILAFTTQVAQYWRIELIDTTNAAGYVQAGRLFIGSAWQPAANMSWGESLGYESDTQVQRSIGGVEYFDSRPIRRVHRFSLNYLTAMEAYENALAMQRTLDVSGEVLVIADSDDWGENLLTYPESFDNAAWSKSNATIVADAAQAPDGSYTADKLVEGTTATTSSMVWRNTTENASTDYTLSFYAKAGERAFCYSEAQTKAPTYPNAFFDLTTGAVSSAQPYTSTAYPNGWWRFSLTHNSGAGATATNIVIATATSMSVRNYTGNGASGIYLWGAQYRLGTKAANYPPYSQQRNFLARLRTLNPIEAPYVLNYQTAFELQEII